MTDQKPGDPQPSNHDMAEAYRIAQARQMLRCYELAHHRPARTAAELADWVRDNPNAVPLDGRGKVIPLYEGGQ